MMPKELRRIEYDELATNLRRVFDRLMSDNEAVVVEKEGRELAVLKPLRSTKIRRPRKASAAKVAQSKDGILQATGGWKDIVDTEAFKAYIYKRRRTSSRPSVHL